MPDKLRTPEVKGGKMPVVVSIVRAQVIITWECSLGVADNINQKAPKCAVQD
jgi:hypothetical protein